MDLSIVVPLYNEAESVIPLCEGIKAAVGRLGLDYEVFLVDDGSTDETVPSATHMVMSDDRVKIIKLSKNFGQTAALDAGFEHARGRVIVTMDGDLQNDPADIERLVREVDNGYDIVAGWRDRRHDHWISRKLPSRIANWLIRRLTDLPIHDNGCGLRAYRADIIRKLPLYSEMHRLLPMIVALTGARIGEVRVRHHPRRFGKSKYGISRIYKVTVDFIAIRIIMTLFRLPLFGFGLLAIPFLLIGLLALVLALLEFILDPDASLVVFIGVSLLCGSFSVFLGMLGILCDLIYRTGSFRVESLLRREVVK